MPEQGVAVGQAKLFRLRVQSGPGMERDLTIPSNKPRHSVLLLSAISAEGGHVTLAVEATPLPYSFEDLAVP